MNPDLFAGPDQWLQRPTEAFEALLASPDFVLAGRPKRANMGARIREESATVYKSQWKKFDAWLGDRNLAFHKATRKDIEKFLFEGLGSRGAKGPAEATRQRYASLLERAYGHAVKVGAIEVSPVPPELLRSVATTGRAAMPVGAPPETMDALQVYLAQVVRDRLDQDPIEAWRPMRDAVMAMVGLCGGLRCKELAHLRRSQLRLLANDRGNWNLELNFKNANTTNTAQAHKVLLGTLPTEVLDAWVSFRFGPLLGAWARANRRPGGVRPTTTLHDPIFPSGLNANRDMLMSDDAINQNFKKLATQAVIAGVLNEKTEWILTTGARGLRRAKIVFDVRAEKDPEFMRLELGFWSTRSVARYQEELANAPDGPPGSAAAPLAGPPAPAAAALRRTQDRAMRLGNLL